MEYEEEGVSPASVPEFGAIFMSNYATRKECFRLKLLGLPSTLENFVKRVKSGMILFLFASEKRELYGVYRACSDGAMDIVPHAFNSSGKQYPAQVRFTVIWYCNPLSEHEFRDAIRENYYSNKKFTFGLSEDQVHRLLCLFSSRKSENMVPRRQLGERIRGDEKISINRGKKFVEEDDPAHTVNVRYNGISPSDGQRADNKRFDENYLKYDDSTEHEGISLGGRRGVSESNMNLMEDMLGFDYDVGAGYSDLISNVSSRDSLYSLRRQSKENQFFLCDTSETNDIRNAIACLGPGDHLARARGDLSNDGFPLGKLAERFEIPRTRLTRIDGQRLFMDRGVLNDHNSDGEPKSIIHANQISNSSAKVRRLSADDQRLFMDQEVHYDHNFAGDSESIIYANQISNSSAKVRRLSDDDQRLFIDGEVCYDHNSVGDPKSIIYGNQISNSLAKVRGFSEDDQIHVSDRTEIRRSVDNCISPILSDRLPLSTGYADLNQLLPQQSLFNSSKPMFEAHYSLSQNQHHNSPLIPLSMGGTSYPTSLAMEKNNYGVSYPTSFDSVLTKSVPQDLEFPEINGTSNLVQDSVRYQSRAGNDFAASIKPSYSVETEDLSPQSYGAFRRVSEVPMRDNQDLYDLYDGRIGNYRSSDGYRGNMEQSSVIDELYENPPPFSRTPIYVRRNLSPSIDFDEPSLASQDRVNQNFLLNATDPVISDHQDHMVNYGMRRVHSRSSFEKYNDYDHSSYQDLDRRPTDSRIRRTSIFSRLSTSSRKCRQVQEDFMDYDVKDESVDEVMENLFGCLGQKTIDAASKNATVGKRNYTEDAMKRREKRFSQVEVKEPTNMTQKIATEIRLATIEEENDEDDASRETRVVGFKRRSDTRRNLTGGKRTGFTGPAVDQEMEGSVQKPEGKLREGEREGKQLQRRKLVRPVFGRNEDLDDGSKGDTSSTLRSTCVTSSCSKAGFDFSGTTPDSQVPQKLVRPAFDKKEEANDNTKRDGVSSLLTHDSSNCIKVSCDCSGTSLGNPSPNSRVRRKLVRPGFDKKEGSNDISKSDGVSHLSNHGILKNKKLATSKFSGKTLRNTNSHLSRENTSCNKRSCDISDTSLADPSPNCRVYKKLVRPVFDKKEELNDNSNREGISDLLTRESLNNEKPVTSDFSGETLRNSNLSSPNSGLCSCPSTGSGLLEKEELC